MREIPVVNEPVRSEFVVLTANAASVAFGSMRTTAWTVCAAQLKVTTACDRSEANRKQIPVWSSICNITFATAFTSAPSSIKQQAT